LERHANSALSPHDQANLKVPSLFRSTGALQDHGLSGASITLPSRSQRLGTRPPLQSTTGGNARGAANLYLESFQLLTLGRFRLPCAVPVNSVENKQFDDELGERLATGGFRFTSQRRHVYDVLLQKLDHPTAEDVFLRAKRKMPDISHATVYNCLDALVQCGLVRKVQLERGATRFCPNMEEHAHYYCAGCGEVFDVALPAEKPSVPRPRGFKVDHYEIAVHGLCGDCANKK